MQRKLSLFLIAILIIGLQSFGGTVLADSDIDLSYSYADEFLKQFVGDGVFGENEQDFIKRQEFTDDIVKIMGYDTDETVVISYTDVPETNTFFNSIYTAKKYGLISASEYFLPENDITVAEAVKIMFSAFGYDEIAEQIGGFPAGYSKLASSRKLLKNINSGFSDKITCRDARNLLYNILFDDSVSLGQIIVKNDHATYTYDKDKKTNLEEFFDVYEIEGTVTQTTYNSLIMGESVLDKNKIGINGTKYNSKVLYSENYLGMNVLAYYCNNDGYNKEVVALMPLDYEEIYIDSKDIIDISNNKLEFIKEGKKKKISFNPAPVYIYNGRRVNKIEDAYLNVDLCDIRILDNDNNGTYDIVFVNSYNYYIVENIDHSTGVLGLQDYGKVNINPDGNLFCFNSNGDFANILTLEKNDVVALKKSLDNELVTVIICSQDISGVVQEYSKGKNTIVIDGVSYEVLDSIADKLGSEILAGRNAAFAIGIDGKIVKIKNSLNNYKYGYLLGVDNKKGGIRQDVQLKILVSLGEEVIFDTDSTVYVDDDKKNEEELMSILGNASGLIKYKLNNKDEIKYIDTPEDYTNSPVPTVNNSLIRYTYAGTLYYRSSPECLVPKACITSSVMFYKPATENGNDEVCVVRKENLVNNQKYTAELYDIDDNGMAGAVVFRSDNAINLWGSQHDTVMVDKITRVVDDDGEDIYRLYCWNNSVLVFYDVDNDVSLLKSNGQIVSRGDVVRIKLNSNKIVRLSTEIDASDLPVLDGNSSGSKNNFTSSFSYIMGYAYSSGMTTLVVSDQKIPYEDVYASDLNVIPLSSTVTALRYNKADDIITPVSLEEIHTAKGMGLDADFVVIKTLSDVGSDVYVFE